MKFRDLANLFDGRFPRGEVLAERGVVVPLPVELVLGVGAVLELREQRVGLKKQNFGFLKKLKILKK